MNRTNQLPRVTKVALQGSAGVIQISGSVQTNLRKPPVPLTFSSASGLMVERTPGKAKPADRRVREWVVAALKVEYAHFKAAAQSQSASHSPSHRLGLTIQRDGFAKALSILEPAFG